MKIHQLEAVLFRAGRQTRHETNNRFS